MEVETFPNALRDGRLAFAGQRRRGHPAFLQSKVFRYSRVSLKARQGFDARPPPIDAWLRASVSGMDWASRQVLAGRPSNMLTTDCCIEAIQDTLTR